MNRRTFIAATGATATGLLSGCQVFGGDDSEGSTPSQTPSEGTETEGTPVPFENRSLVENIDAATARVVTTLLETNGFHTTGGINALSETEYDPFPPLQAADDALPSVDNVPAEERERVQAFDQILDILSAFAQALSLSRNAIVANRNAYYGVGGEMNEEQVSELFADTRDAPEFCDEGLKYVNAGLRIVRESPVNLSLAIDEIPAIDNLDELEFTGARIKELLDGVSLWDEAMRGYISGRLRRRNGLDLMESNDFSEAESEFQEAQDGFNTALDYWQRAESASPQTLDLEYQWFQCEADSRVSANRLRAEAAVAGQEGNSEEVESKLAEAEETAERCFDGGFTDY